MVEYAANDDFTSTDAEVFIQNASAVVQSAGYNILGTVVNNSTQPGGFLANDNIPTSLATVNTIESIFGSNSIANQGGVSDVIAPLGTAPAAMDLAAVKDVVAAWPIDEMAKVMDLDKDQRRYTRAESTIAGSYDPNGIAPDDEDEEQVEDALETVSAHAFQTGVYSLLGQYMGNDVTVLPAGVYVVNGKKVIK